ncbi:PaaI family thioesterase [Maricaulis sp.]|uniref:PaaI family thioesterase n=1 Tax=Maricaulis sp. TaxID=1486257 RepID=UPI0025BD3CFB|nr:PaaI family thioesterase [Maricaulis sp.]
MTETTASPTGATAYKERRYGVATHAELAPLTGLEMLEAVRDGRLPAPPISQALGFDLVAVEAGRAVFEGETGAHLLNPAGTVHGDWALTLIDSAAACAAHSALPVGQVQTTVETKANFTRPILVDTGRVRCEAWIVSQGRTLITTEARVTGPDGRILAHGTSTLMVLKPGG